MKSGKVKKQVTVSHNYFQHHRNRENKQNIEFKVVINQKGTCINRWDWSGTERGQEGESNDYSCSFQLDIVSAHDESDFCRRLERAKMELSDNLWDEPEWQLVVDSFLLNEEEDPL